MGITIPSGVMPVNVVKQHTVEDMTEGINKFSHICIHFISPLNEMAMQEVMKVRSELMTLPYFKHELKKNMNACFKVLQMMINNASEVMEGSEKYYSYIDHCDDDLRVNIEDMRTELQKYFDGVGVVESILWTDMEIARILLEESRMAYRDISKDITNNHGADVGSLFYPYNATKALGLFKKVQDFVVDRQDIPINVNDRKGTVRAYRRFHDKCKNGHFMNRSLKKANKDTGEA